MMDIEDAEKFADEVDRACSIEHALKEEGIKRVLASVEKAPLDFDGATCVECGEDVHPVRLRHGFFRCTYCQNVIEKRKRNHAR